MFLFYGECKVSISKWLVLQGEVPPLCVEGFESVTHHSLSQNHAIAELLGGYAATSGRFAVIAIILARLGIAAEVGMTLRPEPVEGAAHVNLYLGCHVEECQIER